MRARRESIVRDERTLGDVVRNKRLRRGLEQNDVARLAGIDVAAVRCVEQDTGTLEGVRAVLTALRIPYRDRDTSYPARDR